ncbi:hypothetical protein O6H91_05G043800 [Diphasiastrum complanatum]|uniref:Uncharacterized protein n=1 Tax=Diphasiastrum complanatum TaxID=34168 RepID=A0ACC2DMV9_DIPCM|nr:hypothetical protein O6H91_05G043800 [Diphasiastrum complanatum]
MGQCYGKVASLNSVKKDENGLHNGSINGGVPVGSPAHSSKSSYSPSRFSPASPLPNYGTSPLPSTPGRKFRKPFPPPSPAKHIQASLVKRQGKAAKPKEGTIPEGIEIEKPLDQHFGYSKNFSSKYELGHEIGRGHFGHTCYARARKGELKGQSVAVKIISKAKMTTAIAIEDVRREVKILRALTGHGNLVRFYDACEDNVNVYIVMELCEGGELLDRILSRGGRYSEEDAKLVLAQILSIVAFCHLQGVVHRDLKPENFLFTTKDESAPLKAIDFGLSDFIKPDEKLNDIVGSAYYVAPEVLHRSYSLEADIWSIGVITYILLCGSRPFWARTESGIFRRMTAAQALTHPWIRGEFEIPLDLFIYKYTKSYLQSSALKRAALKAVSKTLNEDELFYLRTQFMLLGPNKSGRVSLENFRTALMKNATEAMKESRTFEILSWMDALAFKKMDFEEFSAAAISVRQLEGLDGWENRARTAYQYFEEDGNHRVATEELAQEVGLAPTVPAKLVLHEWIRQIDGKLSFVGFTKLLHGVTPRSGMKNQ